MLKITLFILTLLITIISKAQNEIMIKADSLIVINEKELDDSTKKILKWDKQYYTDEIIDQYILLKKEGLPLLDDNEIDRKLKTISTIINIRFTPDIGNQIRKLLLYNRSFIVDMLTKAEYYFPIYEVEFDKLNIPLELKYVSVIESHLDPKAKSPMGATGLWQFMFATAKYKGMKITTLEDSRKNPYISTQYAAAYLKQLHSIYDDWLLAISSYNAGAGNINKAIRHSGGYKNYWIARPFMPKETQKYVPRIIAIMYAMYFAEDYSLYPRFPSINYYDVTQIELTERLTIKYTSELLNVDSSLLADLNPMLTKNIIPDRADSFSLVIPSYAVLDYEKNQNYFNNDPYLTEKEKEIEDKVITQNISYSGSGKYKSYTIQTGDNLGYIAQIFSCKVSDIKRWNGMNGNFLRVGNKLKIYSNKTIKTSSSTKLKIENNVKVGFKNDEIDINSCTCHKHEIIYGDNLWDISVKYNTSIENIKVSNNIYNNWKLKLGTYLKIPK